MPPAPPRLAVTPAPEPAARPVRVKPRLAKRPVDTFGFGGECDDSNDPLCGTH
jgi:hypothetical protein